MKPKRGLLICLISLIIVGAQLTSASAYDHYVVLRNGQQYFGPDEDIIVDGKLACPVPGDIECDNYANYTPDNCMWAAVADIYIMPDTGGERECAFPLEQCAVAAAHNVIGYWIDDYLFTGVTLGRTKPSGTVPPGCYDIVIDEGQDGWFSPDRDFVLGVADSVAFWVAPYFCPRLASLESYKNDASFHAEQLKSLREGIQNGFELYNAAFDYGDAFLRVVMSEDRGAIVMGIVLNQIVGAMQFVAGPLTPASQLEYLWLGIYDNFLGSKREAYEQIAADPSTFWGNRSSSYRAY